MDARQGLSPFSVGEATLRFVWTDRHGLRAGAIAVSRIEQFGLHMPPGSRLVAALSRIDRATKRGVVNVSENADFAYRLAEAHRTVLEFYLISAALDDIPGMSRQRLTLALGGHDLPDEDKKSTLARDAQFELLVTALIHHAGVRDVAPDEPDVRIKAGDKWIGIAAKRVSSQAQLQKRLRHAGKQIQRQHDAGVEFGIIALNLDAVVNAVFRDFGADRARAAFDSIALISEQFVRSRRESECVVGIQAFATIMGWQVSGRTMALGLDVITHGRWTSPASEVESIGAFLRARGTHLQRELGRLMTLL